MEWYVWCFVEDVGCLYEIFVWYVGEDFVMVVVVCGLIGEGVIELYSVVEYWVGVIGFVLGFVYFGGFDLCLVLLWWVILWVCVLVGSLVIVEV